MFDPEDGGTIVRRNVGKYLSDGRAQHMKRLETSVTPCENLKLHT